MPELDPDDDDVIATLNGTPEGKLRAVLLSNRAQAFLQIGKMDPGGIESKEARKVESVHLSAASAAQSPEVSSELALHSPGLTSGMPLPSVS
eukprot:3666362-Rhodomonas_salina.1